MRDDPGLYDFAPYRDRPKLVWPGGKNVAVWVISFGTAANPVMEACAGADRYFVAADAEELDETFATIAKRMGELRVTR